MAEHVTTTPAALSHGAPRRRSLFTAVPALALALAAPALARSAEPDAELIAIDREAVPLIAEYRGLMDQFFALSHDDPDLTRVAHAADPSFDRLAEFAELADEIDATTMPGFVAKARLLKHQLWVEHGEDGVFVGHNDSDRAAWSLVNAILAVGSGA